MGSVPSFGLASQRASIHSRHGRTMDHGLGRMHLEHGIQGRAQYLEVAGNAAHVHVDGVRCEVGPPELHDARGAYGRDLRLHLGVELELVVHEVLGHAGSEERKLPLRLHGGGPLDGEIAALVEPPGGVGCASEEQEGQQGQRGLGKAPQEALACRAVGLYGRSCAGDRDVLRRGCCHGVSWKGAGKPRRPLCGRPAAAGPAKACRWCQWCKWCERTAPAAVGPAWALGRRRRRSMARGAPLPAQHPWEGEPMPPAVPGQRRTCAPAWRAA